MSANQSRVPFEFGGDPLPALDLDLQKRFLSKEPVEEQVARLLTLLTDVTFLAADAMLDEGANPFQSEVWLKAVEVLKGYGLVAEEADGERTFLSCGLKRVTPRTEEAK